MPQTKFFLLVFLMLFSTVLSARHILSGSMTYECLGNDEYEFTMTIYRDCFGGGADFDNPATISVYQNEDEFLSTIYVMRDVLETTEPILCDGSSVNYCSEKAVYKFTITLLDGFGPYNVVYQRCCWSEIVANIAVPGEKGITVVSTVTELALEVCNTQTEIDMPLSFPACPGEEMTIPILPFDADGDSLAYEICLPFEGGGLEGTPDFPGNANSCVGVSPDPACPPPYTQLPYAEGFDDDNPFPTADGITIDPINGTISFTPTTIGIFIYGLCITEYRDGQVLSRQTHNIETTSGVGLPVSQNNVFTNSWEMTQSYTQEELFFTANSPTQNGTITLFDISGKIISSKNIRNKNEVSVSTQHLNAGIYFATLIADGYSETFKVMVAR